MLRRMLIEAIDICGTWTGKGASGVGVDADAWAEACQLTVRRLAASAKGR
jgi:hypothetical protein